MPRFFLILLLGFALPCAFARADEPAQTEREAWHPKWKQLVASLSDSKTTQAQVLRVLALESGAREVPPVAVANSLRLFDVKKQTRAEWIAAMQDRLLLARKWENDENEMTRRRGLKVAQSAAQLAQRGASGTGTDGDQPLRAAIGEAFLLPLLDLAPADPLKTAAWTRPQLLETIESRFVGFRVEGEGDDEEVVPVAPREKAIAFLRLQIAVCSPQKANWPRVHLAQTLLRGDNISLDDKREAFAALRALVPGSGTLLFRAPMPELARELGETLTEAETRDAARDEMFYQGQTWKAPQLEAWQTLKTAITPREWEREARKAQLDDLARRAALAANQRAALEDAVSTLDGRRALLEELQTEKIAASQTALWARYFRVAAAADAVVSKTEDSTENAQQVFELWWRVRLYERDHWAEKTAHWNWDQYEYFPEMDELNASLAARFIVPLLPSLPLDGRAYEFIQHLTVQLTRARPLWPGTRAALEAGRAKAEREATARGETLASWYGESSAHWGEVALAATDLFTRIVKDPNPGEFVRYDLINTLGAQDRLADTFLVLEEIALWQRRYTRGQNSLWGFLEGNWRQAQRELQTRPTLWKPANP